MENYDCINKKTNEEKDCVVEEFKRVFTEIDHDDSRLIELLSKPCKG